ncbi:Protein tyrosine phosphatase type IVA 1 [Galemys pyrenaicus]|uniref:Protein tyrosine phosphatase type IVA 3 n=1 Tax=Galemys pyrenaicus TaxID=202257 RepID=A0A8J6ABH8_GALPY|nr:Protein tyrosine phosphatase type IVA 1 [Galemys pyrenaicus]
MQDPRAPPPALVHRLGFPFQSYCLRFHHCLDPLAFLPEEDLYRTHSFPSFPSAVSASSLATGAMNLPEPTEVNYRNLRFLIAHSPPSATLGQFVEELQRHGVTTLVRVCKATYDAAPVARAGIHVVHWPFEDGAGPSPQIVDDWLKLVRAQLREEAAGRIAVQCTSGLGRAPVLVALACMEGGMKWEDAVAFIRRERRGAFNCRQLLYLQKYQPKMRLRRGGQCCVQ